MLYIGVRFAYNILVHTQKTEMLNVRLSPEMKQALKAVADAEHRSISNLIEVMIAERCKKLKIAIKPGKKERNA